MTIALYGRKLRLELIALYERCDQHPNGDVKEKGSGNRREKRITTHVDVEPRWTPAPARDGDEGKPSRERANECER
jgi:hypothetical protein